MKIISIKTALNSMHICHIGVISFGSQTTGRESKAIGGIQSYILDLIKYSLDSNLNIEFVGKIYNYEKHKKLIYHEIQDKLSSTNKFLIHLFFKSPFIKIRKDIIIHAHRPDHLGAFIFCKKNPSIISLHGQQAHTINIRKGIFVRTIYHTFEKYALKRATYLIAVDNKTKDFYSNLYPEYSKKILTIPTGVNNKLFRPFDKSQQRDKLNLSNNEKVILFVGRIEPPKRIKEIIEAFNLISVDNKNYKLLLVGDGVQLSEMKDLVHKLKLSESIFFLGVRNKNELPSIYNAADITILYSGNEGSPLSVKESLACGIPVVANDVGDISEIIKDGMNGYIFRIETPNELAKVILDCINKSSGMKEECVQSIAEFTTEKVNKRVIELYKELIDG